MIIGIDFDNTIACYDRAFRVAAGDMGLLPAGEAGDKRWIKARLLARDGGETDWMRLQGRVYGYYIDHARPFAGFAGFVAAARTSGHRLCVISHKSRYGHFDPDRIDLIDAARGWMTRHGFFAADGLGFAPDDVRFLPSRAEKLATIARLACSVFIDDLPELLLDAAFPATTRPCWFAPSGGEAPLTAYRDWAALTDGLPAWT